MSTSRKKIYFLIPYPLNTAPSQRFRFEQYFDALTSNGSQFSVQSFLTIRNWRIFYAKGHPLGKLLALFTGFVRRMIAVFRVHEYDMIFIHRELTPIGPPIFEWLIARLLKKKVVYDFDDAIWLTDEVKNNVVDALKWRSKIGKICSWSFKISCGNEYLSSFARRFAPVVITNPTTVDATNIHNPARTMKPDNDNVITIGWTGSHSTLKYLNEIEPVLQSLEKKFDNIRFVVIADRKPPLAISKFDFIRWNAKSEVDDLMTIDIGVMPLPNDEWSKGKCGFKLIQYLALEIPAVGSPVGVNTSIIESGVNGFFASTPGEWELALTRLILDPSLRTSMGKMGRTKIVANYSVSSNTERFLSFFS